MDQKFEVEVATIFSQEPNRNGDVFKLPPDKINLDNLFRKRQGWRLHYYLRKRQFKKLFIYLLLGWHSWFDVMRTPVISRIPMPAFGDYDYDIRSIFADNSLKDKGSDRFEIPMYIRRHINFKITRGKNKHV